MFMDTSEHANCEHPADQRSRWGDPLLGNAAKYSVPPNRYVFRRCPAAEFFPRIMHHACVCVRVGVCLCVQRWLDLHTSCTAND